MLYSLSIHSWHSQQILSSYCFQLHHWHSDTDIDNDTFLLETTHIGLPDNSWDTLQHPPTITLQSELMIFIQLSYHLLYVRIFNACATTVLVLTNECPFTFYHSGIRVNWLQRTDCSAREEGFKQLHVVNPSNHSSCKGSINFHSLSKILLYLGTEMGHRAPHIILLFALCKQGIDKLCLKKRRKKEELSGAAGVTGL